MDPSRSSATSTPINCKSMPPAGSIHNSSLKKTVDPSLKNDETSKQIQPILKKRAFNEILEAQDKLLAPMNGHNGSIAKEKAEVEKD